MNLVIHLGLLIVMLLIVLSMALSYLSGPITFMKKFGVHKAARGAGRLLWRGLTAAIRWVLTGTRRRIRRAASRALTGTIR